MSAVNIRRFTLLLLFTAPVSALAQEWTRFRGPNGSGVGQADLPVKWTDKDYLWKAPLTGSGNSSPVLWGDKVFVTSGDAKTGQRLVVCLSAADGKTQWTKSFDAGTYRMHLRSSIATATPAVDKDRLYVSWATPKQYTVMALDHQGQTVWTADLGPYKSQHGFGPSPTVFEDLLVVPNDQDDGGSLIGLDAATGAVRWKVPRQPKNATYSTPCVFQPVGRSAELIFTNWQHGVTSVDPKTGKVLWELSCFDTARPERAIASPIVAGERIIATCGFVTAQKHMVVLQPGDPQKGTKTEEVWRLEKQVSYLPSPLVKGDRVFLCSEQGFASCLELATGKLVWQERVPGSFSASPVLAGDRIYCVSDEGEVLVLAAADKFQLLARNPLGEKSQATPAIAGGRIFFRTNTQVIALGGAK